MTADESGAASVEDELARLVADALECIAGGGSEEDVRLLCADHPHLEDDVLQSVRTASSLPALQQSASAVDPLLRKILCSRYRVDKRLGAGAMGAVYSGTDLDLGRQVAIKVVHARLMGAEQSRIRFDREAAALAAISHDSVVKIYDRGLTDVGSPFLVMELIEGTPCSEVLKGAEPFQVADTTDWLHEEHGIARVSESSLFRQMIRWATEVASGLEAAHEAGIYHRDVKPSNIMIRKDGRAVLLDFGIAALEDSETLTRSDAAIGTPAYMAPEVLIAKKEVIKAAQDVYGISATLYHMLTLQAPYDGTPTEIMAALATREPKPAVKVRPGLPRDAQAILDHGLARSPGQRYASAAALEKDLRALLAFQPVSVSPTSGWTRAVRRLRRSKMVMGALLASALLLGVLGIQKNREDQAARRKAVAEEVYLHVPANLGIVTPANRFIADEEYRRQVADVLDRLVNAGHGVVVARNIRASFRLDHGDAAGAKEDMRALASHHDTAFTNELAQRYLALPEDSQSALDLALDGLPDPVEALDFYLAGYHAMRTNRYREAIPLLAVSELDSVRHAEELEILLRTLRFSGLNPVDDDDEIVAIAQSIYEDAVQLERTFGSVSAMSAHLRGLAAVHQTRPEDALDFCDEGLKLAPASHVVLQNAAESAYRSNELERARDYANQALRIIPDYLKLRKILWGIEWNLENFDEARALVRSTDFSSMRSPSDSMNFELARISTMEAIWSMDRLAERSKAAATLALEALSMLPDSSRSKEEFTRYVKACAAGDRASVVNGLVSMLAKEPLSEAHLFHLNRLLPEEAIDLDYQGLRRWMDALELQVERAGNSSAKR